MVEVGRHPNIEVLSYTEVDRVEGEAGNFHCYTEKKAQIYAGRKMHRMYNLRRILPGKIPG